MRTETAQIVIEDDDEYEDEYDVGIFHTAIVLVLVVVLVLVISPSRTRFFLTCYLGFFLAASSASRTAAAQASAIEEDGTNKINSSIGKGSMIAANLNVRKTLRFPPMAIGL